MKASFGAASSPGLAGLARGWTRSAGGAGPSRRTTMAILYYSLKVYQASSLMMLESLTGSNLDRAEFEMLV